MSSNIMFNTSNITDTSNSKFEYHFPRSLTLVETDKVAISKLNLFFSWYNISEKYGNNKFSYLWWNDNGVLQDLHSFRIDNGYYSIGTLNEILISQMTKNGHYLSTDSSYVYFIQLRANPTTYSIEIVYNSLAQNYDNLSTTTGPKPYLEFFNGGYIPTTWIAPPTYEIPQVIVSENFGKLIGFSAGAVLTKTSPNNTNIYADSYSVGSDFAPQLEPSSNFFITCSLVSNDLSSPNNLIDSFSIPNNTSFGDMFSPLADHLVYSKVKPGQYHSVKIEIFDQDFNTVQILDPNILITLSLLH